MNVDDVSLRALIEESDDLHSDALAHARAPVEEICEIGRSRPTRMPDLDRLRDVMVERRRLLKAGGFGLAVLASSGLLRTPFGSAVAALMRQPLSVESDFEVQMLQTAASLENLAVATYEAAVQLPFVRENAVILQFAETTMRQHAEHGTAFNDQVAALGGQPQTAPNPRYAEAVLAAMPASANAAAVVELAATVEEVATDTYLANLTLLQDAPLRILMASVMGVESQHLGTLRLVAGLIAGGGSDLLTAPIDLSALPPTALSVVFPQPFEEPDRASPPAEGAVS